MTGYRILDIFFVVFHSSLVIFNSLGWMWRRTRLLNLILLLLTGASWLFLGLIVGTIGYCPLTEWHFRILRKLGEAGLPTSYIKYLADRLTGLDTSQALVDNLTLVMFLASLIISTLLNIRDRFKHSVK